MPMYEYKCAQCGQVFEVIQRFSDAPLSTHESCGGLVERLISAPAFQFKGSGFYITDYAKSGKSTPGKNGDGAAAKNGGESKGSTTSPSTDSSSSPSTSSSSGASSSATTSSSSADTKK